MMYLMNALKKSLFLCLHGEAPDLRASRIREADLRAVKSACHAMPCDPHNKTYQVPKLCDIYVHDAYTKTYRSIWHSYMFYDAYRVCDSHYGIRAAPR